MTKNNKKYSTRVTPEALVQELLQAHRELVPQKEGNDIPASYFVVAKLVSNMDTRDWEKICAECLPEGWYALELSEMSAYIHMANLTAGKRLQSPELIGQMLLASPFLLQAEKEVIRAKRGTSPLAFVRFGFAPHSNVCLESATRTLHDAMEKHCEICDTLGILDSDSFALLLPGAKLFRAQSIVESVLETCELHDLHLHAGIAEMCKDVSNVQTLLKHAAEALEKALQDQLPLRIYKKANKSLDDTRTLVLSHEKRFLFGSCDEV